LGARKSGERFKGGKTEEKTLAVKKNVDAGGEVNGKHGKGMEPTQMIRLERGDPKKGQGW